MEGVRATPVLREHRLYQTDHLLRRYGFAPDEVVYGADGNLPLSLDPKVAWALAHPERFPVEVRTASLSQLVRVPGIGVAGAKRLIAERRTTVLRDLADLRRIGIQTSRAAGFITIAGRRAANVTWTEQLGLWRPEDDVGVPQVVYDVSPGTFR